MAQADYNIANQSGSAFRSELNSTLSAILSINSGSTAPTTTVAYSLWADTTTGLLKIRDSSNSSFITVGALGSVNLGLAALAGATMTGAFAATAGSVALPGITFSGDLDTGLFRSDSNKLNIATNGVERAEFGLTEVVFNDTTVDYDFRIKGDNNANLFLVDASTDRIGIGISTPTAPLHVALSAASATVGNVYVAPVAAGQARYHLYNQASVAEWIFGQKTSADHSFKLSKMVSGSETDYLELTTAGIVIVPGSITVQSLTFGKGGGAISSNTAAGINALNTNSTGFNNTAIGSGTLQANTLGDSNTAVGFDALNDNTIGISNTAIGRISLPINISGDNNTAVGVQTLSLNTVGDDNTAMGLNALYNTTSNNNTAIGAYALSGNTTGTDNVAVGRAASFSKITGNNNTTIGTNALNANTSGSNNVGIGHNCSSSSDAVSNEVNISNGTVLARYQGAASAWQFVSDVRDKTDIENLTLGLDFIAALKPRKFKWNLRNTEVDRGKPSAGFIAQEVLEAVEAFDASYTNLIDTNDPNQYTFAQANMIPVLVRAVQELSAMVKQLQSDAQG